jgi:hypothetical protein
MEVFIVVFTLPILVLIWSVLDVGSKELKKYNKFSKFSVTILNLKIMKKIFVLSALFIGIVSFGQTPSKPKIKDIDKEVNVSLDSLSKVYKLDVQAFSIITWNGVKTTSISYIKEGELLKKVIKTEYMKMD